MPIITTIRGNLRPFGKGFSNVGLDFNPATSARAILTANPGAPSGLYYINDGVDTFQVYCDMTRNGGGWMLAASVRGGQGNEVMNTGAAGLSTPVYQPSSNGNWGKFSDARTNRMRSRSQNQTNGYTGNWPWWIEAVGPFSYGIYPTDVASNLGGVINMFVYKDAQTFETTAFPGDNTGAGAPFSSGTQRPEWRRIRNDYNEGTTSYVDVGAPNHGTRGFGHHHPQVQPDYTNPRISWARHPEYGSGSSPTAMRSDPWGWPTYGHLWVK